MTVTLIDYGAGNVTSVARALRKLGAEVQLTASPVAIERSTRVILPGVGHCAALLKSLDSHGLRGPLQNALSRGTPFLGICLGLQALYAKSAEAPELAGLGIFQNDVEHLPETVKLPHMGWNQVRRTKPSMLLDGLLPNDYFYFAHSYAATAKGSETAAICEYGCEFAAVIESERTFGVQFHPEKSGAAGAKLLANFLRLAA